MSNFMHSIIIFDDIDEFKKERRSKNDFIYRINHREKISSYGKEYRKKNKENIQIYMKKYRKKNKEKILLLKRKYAENNREKFRKWSYEYREKNKEKICFKDKEYRKNNYYKIKEYKRYYYHNIFCVRRELKLIEDILSGRKLNWKTQKKPGINHPWRQSLFKRKCGWWDPTSANFSQ